MLHGVFRLSTVADSQETRVQAVMLVVRPFAVVCDRTASWLHGVDTFKYRELEILPPIETMVLRGNNRVRRSGCVGGIRDLRGEDVMHMQGIRVTTPLRTAMDLACKLNRFEALAVLDGFMSRHGLSHADFTSQVARYRRRRGVIQLRRLIRLADPRAESSGESWARMAILDAGLPTPELQYWVHEADRQLYRLDLAYPKHRVAVEYDGQEFHLSAEQRAADKFRRDWLRSQGWTIIIVDKNSFSPEAREVWLHCLRAALQLA